MTLAALAFMGGAAGGLAVAELGRVVLGWLSSRAPRWLRALAALVEALVRAGREGRDPGALERRRLLVAGAGCAFCAGAVTFGPLAGAALAGAGPSAVDAGVAEMAVAIADAIGGGRSLRAALVDAAGGGGEEAGVSGQVASEPPARGGATRAVGGGVGGAAGHELRRTAAELAAGAPTDDALEAMRGRVRSPRMDTLVAACLLQRRAGGDLARLLRELARGMEDQARLEDEVRAATAQARFTALIVVLLPVGGALLAELASPGWFAGLWSSFLTAWLVGIALVLQALAAFLMHRLGRVRW
ncbi:MAG TPA: type II secretion system F family protein [Thermoleophilaceae bacterium]|nr:type II secretion system F family protein [Thermoleophilaceae bacterium]